MLKDMHLDMPVVCQQRRDMKIAASCWGGVEFETPNSVNSETFLGIL